jgi:uncharacterized protein (DUF58 family)
MTGIEELLDAEFKAKLERLRLIVRRTQHGERDGERTGRKKGGVIEFAGHRDYAPGDDLRAVDWNAAARHEKLHVKEFLRDERMHVVLGIDRSASMTLRGKGIFSLRAAAALGCVILGGRNALRIVGMRGGKLIPSRLFEGEGAVLPAMDFLAALPGGGETELARALKRLAGETSPGALVVVLSDFLSPDDYRLSLRALAGGRELALLHILSPGEAETPHRGKVTLRDAETGEKVHLHVDEAGAARYAEAVRSAIRELRDFAMSRGIRYHFTRSDVPLEDLLFRFLATRGWIRRR